MALTRKCRDCPDEVQAVCKYAFGRLWADKSDNGKGCDHPLDDVAKTWYARGWTPESGVSSVTVRLPLPTRPARPVRPVRPVRQTQGELKLMNLVDKFKKGQQK